MYVYNGIVEASYAIHKLLAKLKAPAWKQVLCFLFYNYYGNVCIFYDGLANAVSEQTF